MTKIIDVWTDGACSGNPGPGGWAYILRHPATGTEKEGSGGVSHTTNNQMELTGALRALDRLRDTPGDIEMFTDSVYVIKGITQWIWGWRKNGWKTADKKPVKNDDLWRALEAAAARHAAEARIDPVRDDLLAAIAKEGGISREAAQAAGIDPAEFNRRGWRIAKVFTGKGLSLEAMAERLAARGYPVTDANGYGENPMLDALDRSLRGETVKAPDGMEADIAAAAAERDAMQAHEAPLLADHEYAGLDSPNQQRLLDAAVRAQDAGVPLDDIQTITELGGANGYDTAEIIRLLDEETGQRGRATRGGAAASEGAAVDTGGGRADAGPSAESADGQPVKSIEAAPTFAGLDDLIAKYPDLTLTDEAGNEISARDMMAAAAEEVKAARELKPGIDALVACTLQYIGEAV